MGHAVDMTVFHSLIRTSENSFVDNVFPCKTSPTAMHHLSGTGTSRSNASLLGFISGGYQT